MGNLQKYPRWKYHDNGKSVIVKNAEEEAALGGGWGNTPAPFAPYKGPRRDGLCASRELNSCSNPSSVDLRV